MVNISIDNIPNEYAVFILEAHLIGIKEGDSGRTYTSKPSELGYMVCSLSIKIDKITWVSRCNMFFSLI